MSPTNAVTIIPPSGRDAYSGVAAYAARGRDDLRTSAVDAVRYVDARPDATQAGQRSDNRWIDAEPVWPETTISSEPPRTLPFMAQLLAQEGTPVDNGTSGMAPSLRFAAQQAYLTARDSTVDYLSPTPLYDLVV